jgi:uncharacterized membrane protein
MTLLLFASLALNLLILGAIVGWVLSPDGPRRDDGPARSLMGAPFAEALSRPDRRALLGQMRRRAERIEGNRDELRQRFETLLDALAADPWDRVAVETVLEAQRVAALERQVIGEELLLDRLDAMSVDERRAYAQRLEERVRRWRRP